MHFKKILFLSVFIISSIMVSCAVFAEEAAVTPTDSVVIAPVVTPNQQVAVPQEKSDTQWAWGEVTNLDNQSKALTIKYLDYETDQEKELILIVDDKTTFENINSFNELKLKDTLSIDYAISADNKNIAKNISLEKPDAVPPVAESAKTGDKTAEAPAANAPPVLEDATATTTQPAVVDAPAEVLAPESTSAVSAQAQ
ncbi:MAG: hypothetical protein WCY09_03950 [Candidatus Omnitrophota bacterium]